MPTPKFVIALYCTLALLAACGKSEQPTLGPVSHELSADAIFFNGNIITINERSPRAEAVAVRDGKIAQVGALAEPQGKLVESQAQLVPSTLQP